MRVKGSALCGGGSGLRRAGAGSVTPVTGLALLEDEGRPWVPNRAQRHPGPSRRAGGKAARPACGSLAGSGP
jgi:hypothetical protein